MNVQCAGNQFMSRRLIEVIQELRDYLGPEAHGLSDEAIVHRVMCKALGPKRRQSKQKCPGQLSWGVYERSVRKLGLNPRPPCRTYSVNAVLMTPSPVHPSGD